MKIGVISDSHEDPRKMLPKVIDHLIEKEGVKIFLHAGDISAEHLKADLFHGLPVVCALTLNDYRKLGVKEKDDSRVPSPAKNWTFTHPKIKDDQNEFEGRIVDLEEIAGINFRIYLGHKRWDDYFQGPESEVIKTLELIRKEFDGIRYFIAGHHHRQLFIKFSLINCINPGAIQDSAGIFGGYEYAVIDTETDIIIFDRIPAKISEKPPLTLGVISDTLDISEHYSDYWENIASVFKNYKVTDIIHCGNLDKKDIGRPELKKFQVYYNPNRGDITDPPENWHTQKNGGSEENGIPFKFKGYAFFIRLNLGAQMWDQSEFEMHRETLKVKTNYPETRVVLCGSSRQTLYIEDDQMIFVNPGCSIPDQSYAIIELPRGRLTFGRIPIDYQV